MDEKYLSVVASITGVLIGFLLSTLSSWIKTGREARSAKMSTMKLVELETNKNRATILNYWKNIVNSSTQWYQETGEFNYARLGRVISKSPFPVTSKEVFKSCIDRLPLYYSENQLSDIWETYEKIEHLFVLYDRIGSLENESRDEGRLAAARSDSIGKMISPIVSSIHFNENVKDLTEYFEKAIRFVLKEEYIDYPKA